MRPSSVRINSMLTVQMRKREKERKRKEERICSHHLTGNHFCTDEQMNARCMCLFRTVPSIRTVLSVSLFSFSFLPLIVSCTEKSKDSTDDYHCNWWWVFFLSLSLLFHLSPSLSLSPHLQANESGYYFFHLNIHTLLTKNYSSNLFFLSPFYLLHEELLCVSFTFLLKYT